MMIRSHLYCRTVANCNDSCDCNSARTRAQARARSPPHTMQSVATVRDSNRSIRYFRREDRQDRSAGTVALIDTVCFTCPDFS